MAGETYATANTSVGHSQGTNTTGPAQARYTGLSSDREPFLVRARRISRITIYSLFRERGANGTSNEIVPWQTLGAYGVNNVAAKMVQALFPPGIPFINLEQSKKALRDLQLLPEATRGSIKDAVDKGLSGVEQEFIKCVELDGDRMVLYDALRHGLAGGNHGLKVDHKTSKLQSIPLERYVTLRDKLGNLHEFVIEDPMAWETLSEDLQAMCQDNGYQANTGSSIQAPVCIYTHGRLKHGQWKVYQECYGQVVPGSEYTYDLDVLPYIFLRMIALESEHYGRSYCEDYEGDLQTLDGYWQLLTEGAAGLARLIWLIKAGGQTNKKLFAEAPNGTVMTGDEGDVTAARAEKAGDFQFAVMMLERLEARIERIFIVNSSATRNGERVTGIEIKFLAQELDTTLGGVYSNQVTGLQAPYARLKMAACQRLGRITQLPKGTVDVSILTGDAALGRQQKAQTLDEALDTANKVFVPNSPIAPYISISSYLQRSFANRSLDSDGIVRSEDEVQAQVAQQQKAQLVQQVAPEAVRQGGALVQQQVANSAAAPTDAQQPAPAQ